MTGWRACSTAMISPSSAVAVTRRTPGSRARAMTSEWYRAAAKGFGIPANTPRPSCRMGEALPCIGRVARTIAAPYAAPMHWCPRHTPRIGVAAPNRRTASVEIPASPGPPGPGEMTMCEGRSAAMSSSDTLSLRRTTGSSPSSRT